ncbi:MlaE family ABC transporter permease [Mycobacterium sp. PDNC021]|uniref:MlaE family ABC transporter permease n=1 Tax=Mycobacterium sp. PDNC021 TaxID=3391399 RepID=UPI003AAF50D6
MTRGTQVSSYRPLPWITGPVERVIARPAANFLATLGQVALFVGTTIWLLPSTVRWYPKQTIKVLNNLAWGRGALIVDGGVVSTMLLVGFGIGAMVSIEAFAAMDMIGFGALTGVVGGMANVREMAPIAAGIAFAAQAGCRMTAEVGAMRVSEEIDAIEALGIRSIPFVVGTRLLGGVLSVAPAYLATLLLSFVVSRTFVTVVHSQSEGTYQHYFEQFVDPVGLVCSLVKAVAFCAAVTLIHCYYGFFTTGGPAGVGVASGRAIRASLVMIIVLDLVLSVIMWGLLPQYVFRG